MFKKIAKGTYVGTKFLFKATYFTGKTIVKAIISKPSRFVAQQVGKATYKTGKYAIKTSGGLALAIISFF